MSTELPSDPREALEASLTALLLGELPEDQAAFVRQAMAQDAELTRRYEQLKQATEMIRLAETAPTPSPIEQPPVFRLSQQRREELLQRFKTVVPAEFRQPRRSTVRWLVPVGIAALFVALLGAALLPALSRSKSKSMAAVSLTPRAGGLVDVKGKANEDSTKMLFVQRESQALTQKGPAAMPPTTAPEQLRSKIFLPPQDSDKPAAPLVTGDNVVVINGTAVVPLLRGFTEPPQSWSQPSGMGGLGTSPDGKPYEQSAQGGAATVAREAFLRRYGLSVTPEKLTPKQDPNVVEVESGRTLANRFTGRTNPVEFFVTDSELPSIATTDSFNYWPQMGLPGANAASGVEQLARSISPAQLSTFSSQGLVQAPSNAPIEQFKIPSLGDEPSVGKLLSSVGTRSPEPGQKPVEIVTSKDQSFTFPADPNALLLAEKSRELTRLESDRQQLHFKIASERTDLGIPERSLVEIVDQAEPAKARKEGVLDQLIGRSAGKFESVARLRLDEQKGGKQADSGSAAVAYDPYFQQTESEVIQSDLILGRVVDKLNLRDVWAKKEGTGQRLGAEEAIKKVRQGLDIKVAKGTDLLEIRTKDDQPEESAKIANAIAQEYRDYRREQSHIVAGQDIKQLQEQVQSQEQKISAVKEELERLRAQTNNAEPDATLPRPAVPPPIPQPEVQTRENAFSTFSLNVSDVSFRLAAASLEKGALPDPAGIRAEEFINAFDYREPEPAPGAPFAFAWERSRYPFAHNRDLLRFSLKTASQGRQAGRPLNLVLLLDTSGSMERADRVRIIHEALRVLAAQLQAQDTLSVVTFARTARLWVDGVPGDKAAQVVEEVSQLTPQGGTNLEEAMNLGYQTALRHYQANGINRVVLLTDGAANLGDVDATRLKEKVEINRKQGIALDSFGIGWEGYNDDLLEVLTRNGDGRYGFLNAPEEASKEFAGQLAGAFQVAAADVKVQVEFNPARVGAYRQIGYAKHQLTKEQFRDNTVDAAELGSAESGNALYVVEVLPDGSGPLATVRVRFKVPGTSEYQEHAWTVPYNGSPGSLEQSSPAMRLACTAGALAEWLSSSPYAAEITPDALLSSMSGVPGVYGADPRPKKLEWMIRQAKSLAGK